MTDETPDSALRADIRLVTSLLGETLARAEGAHVLDLVERVRARAKSDSLDELPELDLETASTLARAFTAYFHLANVTEQVHRGRALLEARARDGGWVARALSRIRDADVEPEVLQTELARLRVQPVFTAHPTEVARRSTWDKLRQIAALLEAPEGPRRQRRLEEAVELLWSTDEIRIEPPEPVDEARNGIYYFEGLAASALPDVVEELREQLSGMGAALPLTARPLQFGSWMGGDRDGNPNVTPEVTREVLRLQAVHGLRLLRTLVDRLRRDLSVSERLSEVSTEVKERIEALLPGLPEVEPRYRRLNAEEPYRLLLTCVHVRLQLTESRIASEAPHVPGRDYRDDTELLEDLLVLHRSVTAHQGARVSGGQWPACSAPWRPPDSRSRTWTCASTRRSTTVRSVSSWTACKSWTRPMPTSTAPRAPRCSLESSRAVGRWHRDRCRWTTRAPARPQRSTALPGHSTPSARGRWRATSSR